MLEFLEKEQIDQGIINGIREYREKYPEISISNR